MLSFEKEKFEENLDDIMESIEDILNGEGFETKENDEENNKNK